MTTTRRRPDARTDYRHFPAAYTDLLLRFRAEGMARLGPMPLRDAQSARRDLYRFVGFLRNSPATDMHARILTEIASEIVWRIEPGENGSYLTLHWNPIAAAMALASKGNA
jgi:hypothetical protein